MADLITESGRESLSLEDRRDLLSAELILMQEEGSEKRSDDGCP